MSAEQLTLQRIAELVGGTLHGDPDYPISGIATLESAGPQQLSFLSNVRYSEQLVSTRAGAVLLSSEYLAKAPGQAIEVADPYAAFAQLSHHFDRTVPLAPGIDASARIAPDADVAADAQVCANAVIGSGTVVESGCYIGPNVVIGERCRVGSGSRLNANVTLYADVRIGHNAIVHSGAVLGADGFGFARQQGRWHKIAQLGGVRIGDDVEIGACTTIDRGALDDTLIGDGVKLDNQIQIAHNVEVGEHTAMAGCAAVAGSTKIGARCMIAGGAGITGHLTIADDSYVTAMSLIGNSIRKSGSYSSGTGFQATQDWRRNVVRFKKLDELARRVKSLEDKLEEIEGHS
ncbi:UDP-3-O-(3-hydroxymyristoyl)glucosamine N-acyltransferase [Marinobacterium arenosum]|uniref:UDP-3-O-(3-hydroxymyristoyl)glucosamine N-acyltransferase n=1 Tax=Marinobacterium arenosum TaxID=2862496 RepID=UPI001C95196E|nr:UDP-3-O-(3-hydroxymyristoyl)glucosamine N-acyltransferase [Marinobacterium arenosum]MBY4675652.1 UDP-3-O-(3-hydroxymyristoyl)glucosamine N-acyltransferase [Marinobacterium arenosum]